MPAQPNWAEHAAYKAYLFVRPEHLKPDWNRGRIQEVIHAAGVPCYAGSCSEVYQEKAFDGTQWRPAVAPAGGARTGETSLMLLVHPTLEPRHIDRLSRYSAT